MKKIEGLPILFSIQKLAKVSDLIYFDGPLLSHYRNSIGDNYILYWVDADDVLNRWMIIRVGFVSIDKYVNKKITLFELIQSSLDSCVIMTDISSDFIQSGTYYIPINAIPDDYLPEVDSYYEFDPIYNHNEYEHLKQFDFSSLEIHLSGRNVGYGQMHYEDYVLANQKVFALWDKLAQRYFNKLCERYKDDNQTRTVPQAKKSEFHRIMQMDYSFSMAGSVRIILTPREKQIEEFYPSASDGFVAEFANIINCGEDVALIRAYTDKYGPEVMYNYKELVDMSCEKDLNIGVTHYCKVANVAKNVSINDKNRESISQNLAREIVDVEQITICGKFYSINTKKLKYGFESNDGEGFQSEGSFDTSVKNIVPYLSFNKEYRVVVSRDVKQKLTKKVQNYDKIIGIFEQNDY